MLRIFKTLTGEEVTNKLMHGRKIDRAIFSPDDTKILLRTGSSSTISDVKSGNIIGEPINHKNDYEDCSFAEKGKHIIAISGQSISIFDASTGKLTAGPITRECDITEAALSSDGTRLVICNHWQILEILDVQSGDVIVTLMDSPEGVRLLLNGNRVIIDDEGSITIGDVASLSTIHPFNHHH
jgi:DNA-binding beta-propeller fold protein YncE